jgi:hypothetical protein
VLYLLQVLVLAVQNAVDCRELGVAASGTTLFRSTGGSVGVSLFGANGRLEGAGLIARAPDGSLIVVDAGRQQFDRMVVSYGNRLAHLLLLLGF